MKRIALLILACMALLTGVRPLTAARSVPVRAENSMRAESRRNAVERMKRSAAVDSNAFSVMIKDLRTGEVCAEYNASLPLVPASIMKAVTTASLLSHRGPDWRYLTEVTAGGRICRRVLEGDIIIKGSGDPSLNADREPLTPDFVGEIVDALRREGIDSVAGGIVIDQSFFVGPAVPPSWAPGDLRQYYGTGSHAFNFCRNARGKASVADPAGEFRSRLRSAMHKAGITLGGNSLKPSHGKRLFTHTSAPLEEIMRSCMMRSDNLYAEALLRTYAALCGREGSTACGTRLERDYWAARRLPMDGVEIVDGSGLSRSNRMTARFMTGVLERMADNVEYASFFPLAGQEGTLRRFMAGTRLDSYLAMKTGSMNGIQCYAGYLLDEDFAPTHTVVIMVNNLKSDRARLRTDLSDMLLSIF